MLPAKLPSPNGPRRVQPEVLNVAPHLVGAPLATPTRRAAALALDGLVVALLSGAGGLWLVLGLVMVVAQLRQRGEAPGEAKPRRAFIGWCVAALLVFLAGSEAQDRWDAWQHPDRAAAVPSEEAAAERARALAEASRTLKEVQQEVPALARVAEHVDGLARAASASAGSASGAASAPPVAVDPQAQRIAELEAALKEARQKQPLSWRDQWRQLWDEIASTLGWGIVYFSLLPAWWGGQTVGKKVFGLRVVELTGQPMTVMRSLKRYGGYAAGLSTGGLGFAQALWDPNRQALQDKAAHTVVLDLRAAAAPPRPPDT